MLRSLTLAAFLALAPVAALGSVVTFGLPDRVDLPDGATSSWSMTVPNDSGLSGYTGGVLYHAINTKGTGAQNGRCTVDSSSSTQRGILLGGLAHGTEITVAAPSGHSHETVEYKDPEDRVSSSEYQFGFVFDIVDDQGQRVGNTPIDFSFTIEALNGATFSSEPTAVIDSNGDGVDLFAAVNVPAGVDISTTNTMQVTLSAVTIVPEPTALGLLALAGVALVRRRGAFPRI